MYPAKFLKDCGVSTNCGPISIARCYDRSVKRMPVKTLSTLVNVPTMSADFFITFSFGFEGAQCSFVTAGERQALKGAGHSILLRDFEHSLCRNACPGDQIPTTFRNTLFRKEFRIRMPYSSFRTFKKYLVC